MILKSYLSQQEPKKKKVSLVTKVISAEEYKTNEAMKSSQIIKEQYYEPVE